MSLLKKGILFTVGLVSEAEEKLESFSQEMVKKGAAIQQEAKKKMDERTAASRTKKEQAEKAGPETVMRQMVEAGLATREELRKLEERIAALESRLAGSSRS